MTVTHDGTNPPLGDDPDLDLVEEAVATDLEPDGTGAEDAADAPAEAEEAESDVVDDGDDGDDEDEPFVVSP